MKPRALTLKQSMIIGLGSGLEYYDFILFGMLANYLSKVFFPIQSSSLALMKTFSLFAIAYFIRPVGGILFAHWGDKKGRKSSFNYSILLMACATLLIGLLPTYQHVGTAAAFALLFCRLLQGLAQGAELPGAITLLCESVGARQGLQAGFLFGFVGLGAGLASLVVYALTHFFHEQDIINYAWRLPFLFGGGIAFLAAYLRRHGHESPLFDVKKQERVPLFTVLSRYPKALLKGMSLILLPAVLIIFKLYFPELFSHQYEHSLQDIYLSLSISLVFAGFYQVMAGLLSDRCGQKPLYFAVSLITLCALPSLFAWMGLAGFYPLLWGMMVYQVILSTLVVSYVPLLAASFPTSVRFTGVAMAYNCTYSLAALCPVLTSFALSHGIGVNAIYWTIALLAVPGLMSLATSHHPALGEHA